MSRAAKARKRAPTAPGKAKPTPEQVAPDWTRKCEVCGEKPIMPITGMCGPCTTGESETYGGNW